MRVVAILFIVASVTANFIYNQLTTLVLAMFSFPVLLWLLLKKKKKRVTASKQMTSPKPEQGDTLLQ
jgi:hypothetical protein